MACGRKGKERADLSFPSLPSFPPCCSPFRALSLPSVLSDFHSTRFHIATMKDKFQAQAQSDLTQTFSDSAMAQDPGNPTLVEEEISAQIVRSVSLQPAPIPASALNPLFAFPLNRWWREGELGEGKESERS